MLNLAAGNLINQRRAGTTSAMPIIPAPPSTCGGDSAARWPPGHHSQWSPSWRSFPWRLARSVEKYSAGAPRRSAAVRSLTTNDLLDCTRRNLGSHGDAIALLSAWCNRVTTNCSDPWASGCPPSFAPASEPGDTQHYRRRRRRSTGADVIGRRLGCRRNRSGKHPMPARYSAPSQPAGDLWNAFGRVRQSVIRTTKFSGNPGRDCAATPTLVAHISGRSIVARLVDDAGIVGIAGARRPANNGTFS